MTQSRPIYTVSQINTYIKSILDGDRILSGVYIRGEISNYRSYPSGHHYFSLKDATGALRCVLFKSAARRLRFQPGNGMKVIAFGRVTVFQRDGQYQLYVDALTPDGVGELYVAFEQLKARLHQEGLFAPEHKKPVPRCPATIAIITSPAGAAIHDMLRILRARWPMAAVKLLPVRVQGAGAAQELAGAVRYANRWQLADVILIGRGGGSMEDLWAFNEEILARAVYESELPVISAVGHEPDVTIIDFVADLRAATPSNAAELAVPDRAEVAQQVTRLALRSRQAIQTRLQRERQRLDHLSASPALTEPMRQIEERRMLLDERQERLAQALRHRLSAEQAGFAELLAKLDALSPLKVLGRGYAYARNEAGEVVTTAASVELGERLSLRLAEGTLGCTVMERNLSDGTERE